MKHGAICGISGKYVIDLLRAGNDEFKHIAYLTKVKLEMDPDRQLPANFSGFHLEINDKVRQQTQRHYLSKLENMDAQRQASENTYLFPWN